MEIGTDKDHVRFSAVGADLKRHKACHADQERGRRALCEFHLPTNRALDLCWQHGYRQLLVDQARTMQDLWQQLQWKGDMSSLPDAEFLRDLRTGMEPAQAMQRVAGADVRRDLGLIDKEVEILMLLAEGLCNKKTAATPASRWPPSS